MREARRQQQEQQIKMPWCYVMRCSPNAERRTNDVARERIPRGILFEEFDHREAAHARE
jgi:hypothetical protein